MGQNPCFREQFDIAVARAVAEMRVLGNTEDFLIWFFIALTPGDLLLLWCFLLVIAFPAEYCLPLVRVGGLFIAAKGHDPEVCNSYQKFNFKLISSADQIINISCI